MKLFVGVLCVMSMLMKVQANTATFKCVNDGTNKQFEITDLTTTNAVAKVYAKGKETFCGTGVTASGDTAVAITTTAGNLPNKGPFAVTITVGQKDACGLTADTTNAELFTLVIFTQEDATVLRSDDVVFTFLCDFAKPNNQDVKTSQGLTVTGDPTVKGVAEKDIPMTLTVWNVEGTPAATTTAELGKEYTLRATLTDTLKIVKSCRMASCKAGDNENFANTISMYKDDGCGDPANKVAEATDKFELDGVQPAGDKKRYISAKFKAFTFKTNTVFFQCTCQGCTDDLGTNECNKALVCSGKRRKRSVVNNSTNANARAVVWVLSSIHSSNPAAEKTRCEQVTTAKCLSHVSFISIVAILALLLLVSLGVSVFFCTKLTRGNSQAKMEAYPNPAYKA